MTAEVKAAARDAANGPSHAGLERVVGEVVRFAVCFAICFGGYFVFAPNAAASSVVVDGVAHAAVLSNGSALFALVVAAALLAVVTQIRPFRRAPRLVSHVTVRIRSFLNRPEIRRLGRERSIRAALREALASLPNVARVEHAKHPLRTHRLGSESSVRISAEIALTSPVEPQAYPALTAEVEAVVRAVLIKNAPQALRVTLKPKPVSGNRVLLFTAEWIER